MMASFIPLLDLIGSLGFLVAGIIGLMNYQSTRRISAYWLVFALAGFAGFAWALLVALEWLGVAPVVLDDLQQVALTATATAFAIGALLANNSLIQPTG